jgi:hypothetical protein
MTRKLFTCRSRPVLMQASMAVAALACVSAWCVAPVAAAAAASDQHASAAIISSQPGIGTATDMHWGARKVCGFHALQRSVSITAQVQQRLSCLTRSRQHHMSR